MGSRKHPWALRNHGEVQSREEEEEESQRESGVATSSPDNRPQMELDQRRRMAQRWARR